MRAPLDAHDDPDPGQPESFRQGSDGFVMGERRNRILEELETAVRRGASICRARRLGRERCYTSRPAEEDHGQSVDGEGCAGRISGHGYINAPAPPSRSTTRRNRAVKKRSGETATRCNFLQGGPGTCRRRRRLEGASRALGKTQMRRGLPRERIGLRSDYVPHARGR